MAINPSRAETRLKASTKILNELQERLKKNMATNEELNTQIATLLETYGNLDRAAAALRDLDPAPLELQGLEEQAATTKKNIRAMQDLSHETQLSNEQLELSILGYIHQVETQELALNRKTIAYPDGLSRHLRHMRHSRMEDSAKRTQKTVREARETAEAVAARFFGQVKMTDDGLVEVVQG